MPLVHALVQALYDHPGGYAQILEDAGFDVRFPADGRVAKGMASEEETVNELRGASAVIAASERYSERVIEALPELRVIAKAGVGFDRIDVEAASRHGVVVTITPKANHEAVAESSLALLFAVAKRIVFNDLQVRSGQWPRRPLEPIRGETMGILGLGRIGRSMATRCIALGMNVIAAEAFPDEQFMKHHTIELVSFSELLRRSDYLSIHCPLNDSTRGLFNRAAFEQMKPHAVLINTARGPIINEKDLIDALTSGRLRGAGLDVFEDEPPAARNPLFELDNVVLSPHIAGADNLSMEQMGIDAAESIIQLHQGMWPEASIINNDLRHKWTWHP